MTNVDPHTARLLPLLWNKPKEWETPKQRSFVREGLVYEISDKKKKEMKNSLALSTVSPTDGLEMRYLILFDDCILLTKVRKGFEYPPSKAGSLRLMTYISLREGISAFDTRLEDVAQPDLQFNLMCPSRAFYIVTKTPGDKAKWIRDINATIAHLIDRKTKRLSADAITPPSIEPPTYSSASMPSLFIDRFHRAKSNVQSIIHRPEPRPAVIPEQQQPATLVEMKHGPVKQTPKSTAEEAQFEPFSTTHILLAAALIIFLMIWEVVF
eukprot:TRINITY_DN1354_c0_g1_i1.p1 TRINITY_DN1354_c0_g1~~TRINITY_DN1354_c0_g1_i1.p1  ORF type:complete len:280 (+),score=96.86 TRINITY_DN1354_c0_g1_i1:39-842(+)